jgi:hypothetical protein
VDNATGGTFTNAEAIHIPIATIAATTSPKLTGAVEAIVPVVWA